MVFDSFIWKQPKKRFPKYEISLFLILVFIAHSSHIFTFQTCEDLIRVAKKLKVDIKEIDTIVKELTEAGITDATRIVRIIREKLVDMAVNFTCKSILPEKVRFYIYIFLFFWAFYYPH